MKYLGWKKGFQLPRHSCRNTTVMWTSISEPVSALTINYFWITCRVLKYVYLRTYWVLYIFATRSASGHRLLLQFARVYACHVICIIAGTAAVMQRGRVPGWLFVLKYMDGNMCRILHMVHALSKAGLNLQPSDDALKCRVCRQSIHLFQHEALYFAKKYVLNLI